MTRQNMKKSGVNQYRYNTEFSEEVLDQNNKHPAQNNPKDSAKKV